MNFRGDSGVFFRQKKGVSVKKSGDAQCKGIVLLVSF